MNGVRGPDDHQYRGVGHKKYFVYRGRYKISKSMFMDVAERGQLSLGSYEYNIDI